MGIYDSNGGSLLIPANSVISSINSNRGTIVVGYNSKVSECNENRGNIQFQLGLCLGNIINNYGHISIANGSKVISISNNRGSITLASDCVLLNTKDNYGNITGGIRYFCSGKSAHEYGRNIFYPYSVNAGTVSCGRTGNTFTTLLGRYNVGSLGEELRKSLKFYWNSESNSSHNKSHPSKYKKEVPVPSAPLLDIARKDNCSVPAASDSEQTLCVICMERPKNVAFQCGHLCCKNCSEKLQMCHMCRVKISQKINLFL